MNYYSVLGLNREPFSTSPDPDFFYRSTSHETALKRLEIAIRLRRGLSIILGDIGAGKTTVLRTLMRQFSTEKKTHMHVILDPAFDTVHDFMSKIAGLMGLPARATLTQTHEDIQRYLLREAAQKQANIALIIDEGQKLYAPILEALRTLLNFETNNQKLLQVVIFAQMELTGLIHQLPNFNQRVALKYTIVPLDEEETRAMIQFRLAQAGYRGAPLFTHDAARAIYRMSRGCPRIIAMMCHDALAYLIMHDTRIIDAEVMFRLVATDDKYTQYCPHDIACA